MTQGSKPSSKTLEDILDSMTLSSTAPQKEPKGCGSEKSSKVKENCVKLKKLCGDDVPDSLVSIQNSDMIIKAERSNTEIKQVSMCTSPIEECIRKDKLSFEHLLENEEWTVADFVKDDEIDLSDIVHRITKGSAAVNSDHKLESTASQASQIDLQEVVKYDVYDLDHVVPDSPPRRDYSFEDDIPYTPLIERVRKMHATSAPGKRTSILASLKGRRFSESFDAFCLGDNVTSSPKADDPCVANSTATSHLAGVTFSLGITNFLENSK